MKYLLCLFVLVCPVLAFADTPASDGLSLFSSVFSTDSYTFIDTFFERAVAWVMLAWLELKISSIAFAYDIAYQLVTNLGIGDEIEYYLAEMDAKYVDFFVWLNLPQCINTMLSAHVATFVMRMF